MRKSTGNMYSFVTHTWNVCKGKCPHNCSYCFMKRFPQGELRFDENELKTNLGNGNFIFVGSSCDMFAELIPEKWILKILEYCSKFDNKYLFQSKNPERILDLFEYLPSNSVIGTTIETNRWYPLMGDSPHPTDRAVWMYSMPTDKLMCTIEPIMDFDLDKLVDLIEISSPEWVNIGADSKGHNLPEPSKEKILQLIEALSKITEIKKKSNLDRILNT